jgi:hypothetical protein
MKRYINFKNIAPLILSISFLLGIGQIAMGTNANSSKENSNGQEIIQQSDKNNQNAKLINAFNELKDSIKSFNSKLPLAVNNPSQQNEVNSQDVILKIEKLKKELSTVQQTETVKKNILILEEINTTIAPLKDGLQPDGVSQVQKKLDFFVREGISKKSYGKFGETTQQEIEKFLNQNLNALEKKVSQIKLEKINIASPQNNLAPAKNNDKSKELESQILELKNDIRKISAVVYILLFIILVGMGIYGYKFYIFVNTPNKKAVQNNNKMHFVDIDNFQIELNEIYKSLNRLDQKIKEIENRYQNPTNQTYLSTYTNTGTNQPLNQNRQVGYIHQPVKSNLYSQSNISNSDSNLLSAYNLNSRSLSQSATTVSESEYTAEQRRLGRSVRSILESNNRGNYWILSEGSNEYLFPKGGMKINEHNYHTIAAFFECMFKCQGSQATDKFKLIKPAKVVMIGSSQTWQVTERGIIEFE